MENLYACLDCVSLVCLPFWYPRTQYSWKSRKYDHKWHCMKWHGMDNEWMQKNASLVEICLVKFCVARHKKGTYIMQTQESITKKNSFRSNFLSYASILQNFDHSRNFHPHQTDISQKSAILKSMTFHFISCFACESTNCQPPELWKVSLLFSKILLTFSGITSKMMPDFCEIPLI